MSIFSQYCVILVCESLIKMDNFNESSLEALIIENTKYLYNFAYKLTGSKASAEDLVQELFVTLTPENQDIGHVRHPRAWLSTILYRLFVKNWRKEKRSPIVKIHGDQRTADSEYNESDPIANAAASDLGPYDCLEQDNLRENLLSAIEKLNKDQKELITLHDAEGYTLPELEKILGIPLGTLKSRLHRARSKLENLLKKKELY